MFRYLTWCGKCFDSRLASTEPLASVIVQDRKMKNLPKDFTREEEIAQVKLKSPHVVILGAGASLAACPNGDMNGRRLPLMYNFVEVLNLTETLSSAGIDFEGRNFEEIYDQLYKDEKLFSVKQELEGLIYDYFNSLILPDHPTIYDYLVLSLRDKDVIATFNWDPFLTQAYRRNARRFKLSRLYFLHGNVTIGYCENDKVMGVNGNACSRCDVRLTPSKLLYPISEKNYHLDGFVSGQWKELENAMKNSFMITMFGYGAPKSDVSAIELLKEGWGDKYQRTLEQTEVIDIRDESDLRATWEPFIHTHHYEVHDNFYDSWIANHPRRTGEAWLNQYIDALYLDGNPIPRDADFSELWDWFDKLRKAEVQ